MYKYRPIPGKQFSSVTIHYDEIVSFTFTQRNGESSNMEFRLSDYVAAWTPGTRDTNAMYQNIDVRNLFLIVYY
jgi:hypothetical protein